MSDLEDEDLNDIKKEEVIRRIKSFIDGKSYDLIFTHGKNGEYGHKRHVDVHEAVVEMLSNKDLVAEQVFFFSYVQKGASCRARKTSDKFIKLNRVALLKKKFVIKVIYNFQIDSFEEKSCQGIEAFKVKR